ncbi:hypothetical protein [uncultured Helicobacter sp.]|uniref:hypothetical protein n=1 Tax=uncultured Helicobacter sp. TaxID=175537 RepID=UPI002618AE2A|nr:hypothetical protein [uncultured Helicobacter sp.]
MRQICALLLVSVLFGATSLAAVEGIASNAGELQKSEKALLFGDNVQNLNVETLSEKEMQETQGEFWGGLTAGLIVLAVEKKSAIKMGGGKNHPTYIKRRVSYVCFQIKIFVFFGNLSITPLLYLCHGLH